MTDNAFSDTVPFGDEPDVIMPAPLPAEVEMPNPARRKKKKGHKPLDAVESHEEPIVAPADIPSVPVSVSETSSEDQTAKGAEPADPMAKLLSFQNILEQSPDFVNDCASLTKELITLTGNETLSEFIVAIAAFGSARLTVARIKKDKKEADEHE